MGFFRTLDNKHQQFVVNILNSRIFKIIIGLIILCDLAVSILYNTHYGREYREVLQVIPYFASLIFTFEYLERLNSAPTAYHPKIAFRARLKYVTSFFGIIDLISIMPFVIPTFFNTNDPNLITIFDLSRIFLVFKLSRYSRSFREILLIFIMIHRELFATIFFIGVILIFSSALMFYIESSAQPDAFHNIGDGLWWGINTITSVGYGDIHPVTVWGKILGGVTAFLGVLMFALPTALISSAFIKYYARVKR
ncbi:MAG: ion transporter [Rikenellaceae bacterium]